MGGTHPDLVLSGSRHIVYIISGGEGQYRVCIVPSGINADGVTRIEQEWTDLPVAGYRKALRTNNRPEEVDAFAESVFRGRGAANEAAMVA